jgi:hypothetical protein
LRRFSSVVTPGLSHDAPRNGAPAKAWAEGSAAVGAKKPATHTQPAACADLEPLEPRFLAAADLRIAFDGGLDLPAVIVPGDRLKIPVIVSNTGDDQPSGTMRCLRCSRVFS